jgi:hypothetical protein
VICLSIAGVSMAGEAHAQGDDARYALAGGCYALKSVATGRVVSKAPDGRYTASGGGEPFRMQATALGRSGRVLAVDGSGRLIAAPRGAGRAPVAPANVNGGWVGSGCAGPFRSHRPALVTHTTP